MKLCESSEEAHPPRPKTRKRKRLGARPVRSLTEAELNDKRERDRKGQRAARQRTKNKISDLEEKLIAAGKQIQDLQADNSALDYLVSALTTVDHNTAETSSLHVPSNSHQGALSVQTPDVILDSFNNSILTTAQRSLPGPELPQQAFASSSYTAVDSAPMISTQNSLQTGSTQGTYSSAGSLSAASSNLVNQLDPSVCQITLGYATELQQENTRWNQTATPLPSPIWEQPQHVASQQTTKLDGPWAFLPQRDPDIAPSLPTKAHSSLPWTKWSGSQPMYPSYAHAPGVQHYAASPGDLSVSRGFTRLPDCNMII